MNNYYSRCNLPGTVSDLGNTCSVAYDTCGCARPCPPPMPPIPPMPPVPPIPPVIAPTVTVGSTVTGTPGSAAYVRNSGTPTNAVLDFIIPAGVQGAQGTAAPLLNYGGLYGQISSPLTLVSNTTQTVPFSDEMPSNGVTYTTANNVTITSPGDYLITYTMSGIPSANTNLIFNAAVNNDALPGSMVTETVDAGQSATASNAIITTLAAGDNVSLQVTSSNSVTMSFNNGNDVTLAVRQLS